MAKDTIIQIRIDGNTKEAVEQLYKNLGTSFQEAVRVFAVQSLTEQGFPFVPKNYKTTKTKVRGRLSAYASENLREQEKTAFINTVVHKHEQAD